MGRRSHRRREMDCWVPKVPPEEETSASPLPMQDTCEAKSEHDEKKESSSGCEDRSVAETSRPQRTPLSVPAASVENISVGTSSIAANLQELTLKKEDHGAPSAEERPPVTIPKHLQVSDADLSRFKFGDFDAEELRKIIRPCNTQPIYHQPYARDQDYDQLRSLSDEGVVSTPDIVLRDFGSSSTLQPEIARTESLDLEHGPQHNFPSVSGYSIFLPDNIDIDPESYLQQQNPYPASDLVRPLTSNSFAKPQPVENYDISNLFQPSYITSTRPLIEQPHTSSLSSNSFAAPQPAENYDLSNLFQPSYITSARRFIELIRSDTTSSHSTQQSTTSIPTGHMRPQHLPVDRNSQPTLPTNVIVPFQPLSNAYPYRLPTTSTHQEAAIASGLSGSEIPTGIRGRPTLNPFAPPYTPVRHNQPSTMQLADWNYYIPQQSFPRPVSAMLTSILSNLPTEYQEHQGNLAAGNSNHSEDSQSHRPDQ